MQEIADVIDYSEAFPKAMIAQGKGCNFLAIYKLKNKIETLDGTFADYEIHCRALSAECKTEKDEAWACVMGSDSSYFSEEQIKESLEKIKSGDVDLFEEFNLFE